MWTILAIVIPSGLWLLVYLQPWQPIGPFGYWHLDLGMSEPEIAAILRSQAPLPPYASDACLSGAKR